jgi:hypothetical protein
VQLDKTRVAIRERSQSDIMDLAVRVVRGELAALVLAWLIGALPLALVNAWVLSSRYPRDAADDTPTAYLWHLAVLMIWEIPLATAPITLYLGKAIFVERPSRRELIGQYFSRLGQLLWYQGVLRGCLPCLAVYGYVNGMHASLLFFIEVVMCLIWFGVYVMWPYQNEVLLLERSPWRSQHGRVSTWTRTRNMHALGASSQFGRWIVSLAIAALLTFTSFMAMDWIRSTLSFDSQADAWTYQLLLPLAAWIVIGYFATVRFLSYLDLRIRTEGWEIELLLRAEGARLTRQLA